MIEDRITAEDMQDMVRHWLGCPAGAYLGMDYGNDVHSILQTPQAVGLADGQVAKCRADVPILSALGADDVQVFHVADEAQPDRARIVFWVAGGGVESRQ